MSIDSPSLVDAPPQVPMSFIVPTAAELPSVWDTTPGSIAYVESDSEMRVLRQDDLGMPGWYVIEVPTTVKLTVHSVAWTLGGRRIVAVIEEQSDGWCLVGAGEAGAETYERSFRCEPEAAYACAQRLLGWVTGSLSLLEGMAETEARLDALLTPSEAMRFRA